MVAKSQSPGSEDHADQRDLLFSPFVDGSLVQQTQRRLTEAIVAGLLQVGERLPPETELAELLGIAPMTLRTALGALRRAGYLETRRGRTGGTFIARMSSPPARYESESDTSAELNAEYVQDLFDYRRAIAAHAAALAAERAGNEQVVALEQLVMAVESCTSYAECVRLDAQLHINTAAASGSKRLWKEQAVLEMESNFATLAIAEPAQEQEVIRLIVADQREIVRAIRAREPQHARAAVASHLDRGCVALLAMIGRVRNRPTVG
ncbi:FadR/GntR family transcriptional regulator [Catenulispora rubra]|uniref:FadR/GntR family transcriptional regulator n=1 Tax=Catenulispora rubra TaxID=280293 RepID=UPI001E375F81|nr:FCD domain-containing protein [Catenulispora rubra]